MRSGNWKNTTAYAEDLASTNGTKVNGHVAQHQVVHHLDLIEVGMHKLHFFDDDLLAAGGVKSLETTVHTDFEKTMMAGHAPPPAPARPASPKRSEDLSRTMAIPAIRAGPAQDGLHPQGKFPRAERLGHVVVGTALEPQHAVAFLAECRQHDHRQGNPRVLPLTQAPAHLQAADSWQHQVEHDQIRPPRRGKLQGSPPVRRMPGFQASVAQVVHDDLRHGQVVLDNKNACVHHLSLRTSDRHREQLGSHLGITSRYFFRLS